MDINTILACVATLFAVTDGLTTWYGLSRGRMREANPLVAWLIQSVGLAPAMFASRAVLTWIFWVPAFQSVDLLSVLAACFFIVSANNLRLILRARKASE